MRLLLLALAAIVGDALTTTIGLWLGHAEHNPLPSPLLLIGHVAVVALLVGAYRSHPAVARWPCLAIAAFYGALTIANTFTLSVHLMPH